MRGNFLFPYPLFIMANTPEQAARPASNQDDKSSVFVPSSPVASVRYQNVIAAIFGETVTTSAGKEIVVYNVSLRVGYRDKNGNWKHTNVLSQSDLLPATEALRECYRIIEERRND